MRVTCSCHPMYSNVQPSEAIAVKTMLIPINLEVLVDAVDDPGFDTFRTIPYGASSMSDARHHVAHLQKITSVTLCSLLEDVWSTLRRHTVFPEI